MKITHFMMIIYGIFVFITIDMMLGLCMIVYAGVNLNEDRLRNSKFDY